MTTRRPLASVRRPSRAARILRALVDPYVQCCVLIALYLTLILIVPALTRMHFDAQDRRQDRVSASSFGAVSNAEAMDDPMWRTAP